MARWNDWHDSRMQRAFEVIDALADEAGAVTGQLEKQLREETNALRTVIGGLQNQLNEIRDELREARKSKGWFR